MTKVELLIAAVKGEHPERSEDEIIADLLARGAIQRGYVIDESTELESNHDKPEPARLVKSWVVFKDGKAEFRSHCEEEAIAFLEGCREERIDADS